MRKILLALIVLALVVAGVLVLAVVNVNGLLEDNRERLGRLASDAVGREVTFDQARVAFPGRLSIEVSGLEIAEDPAFGTGDFIDLETAYVAVEIWPALQRRLELTGVRLDRPTIRVIQTAKGFNFSTLGSSDADAAGDQTPAESDESASMALAIAGFRILDATIRYEDRTSKPPLELTIENFESSGSNIFGDDPIEIAFTGLLRPAKGDAGLSSPVEGNVRVTDLANGVVDLRLESPKFHPILLGLDFEEGDAVERLESAVLDVAIPANADRAGYPIALRASRGRLAGFDFEALDTKLVYKGPKLDIQSLTIGLAGGKVDLAGNMTFGPPGRSPFALDTTLTSLEADELASSLVGLPRGYLSGRIGGEVELSGDSLEWDTLKRTLAGKIELEMDSAKLTKVNVLDQLVTRLVADPGLGRLAANSIREISPRALEGSETVFEAVNLAFDVANGRLKADQIQLAAGEYAIQAAGAIGLDGVVAGDGRIRFSEDLSAKILKKADRLAPLLGDGKVVELPLVFSGSTSSIKLAPDVAALTRMARSNATAEVREEATKKLTEAIFGKRKAPAEPIEGEDPAAPSQADRDRDAAAELINEGLGRIFGK